MFLVGWGKRTNTFEDLDSLKHTCSAKEKKKIKQTCQSRFHNFFFPMYVYVQVGHLANYIVINICILIGCIGK